MNIKIAGTAEEIADLIMLVQGQHESKHEISPIGISKNFIQHFEANCDGKEIE